jgi:hypothetical protein
MADVKLGTRLRGLSGLSRRSFSVDGSAASAKKLGTSPKGGSPEDKCELRNEK